MKSHCPDPNLRSSSWFWKHRAEEGKNSPLKGVFLNQNKDYTDFIFEKQKGILENFVTKDKKVIDLGCGCGRLSRFISDIAGSYIGVDFCDTFIKEAKESYPDLDFRCLDVRNTLPFQDKEFDICLLISCFTSIEVNFLKIMEEAKRIATDVLMVEEGWMRWDWEMPNIPKWPVDKIDKKIGIVGYANYQGVGIIVQDFKKQLGIEKHLVIPASEKGTFPELAPDGLFAKQLVPSDEEIREFLKDIDVVVAIEIPYNSQLFKIAKEMGKRTIFFPMWEWFDASEKQIHDYVDLFVCTSEKCFEEIPYPKKYFIPEPLDTDYFPNRKITGKAKVFVHNAGFGGLNWRKGTNEAVSAFTKVKGDIMLLLRTQKPFKDYPCYELAKNDPRIKIFEGTMPERKDLYAEGDVLIVPHYYDGQCLVAEEGMACGMPVIVTNAPPMNEFTIDKRLLVKVGSKVKVRCKHSEVYANIPDVDDLCEKIKWCMSNDLTEISQTNRRIIEKDYSWNVLRGILKKFIMGEQV